MSTVDYTPAVYNVRCMRGDTFAETFTFVQEDDTPIDLTGSTFRSHLRRHADGDLVAEFTCTIEANTCTRALTAAQTAMLEGTYVQDLEWTNADGVVSTEFYGNFEVLAEVSHD